MPKLFQEGLSLTFFLEVSESLDCFRDSPTSRDAKVFFFFNQYDRCKIVSLWFTLHVLDYLSFQVLFSIHVSTSIKFLFMFFAHLLIELFIFFLLIYRN